MKFILLTIFTAIIYIASGQQKSVYDVNFDLQEKSKKRSRANLIGEYQNFKYTATVRGMVISGISVGFRYEIEKWAVNDVKPVLKQKAVVKGKDFKLSIFNPGRMIVHGSKIYHFFSSRDSKNRKMERVFYSEYDAKSLRFLRTKEFTTCKKYKRRYPVSIYFVRDEDNPEVLGVAAQYVSAKTKNNVNFTVFDGEMNKKFSSVLKLSGKNGVFRNFSISDNWIQYTTKIPAEKKTPEKLSLHLLDMESGINYEQRCKLDNKNFIAANYKMKRSKPDSFLLYGFYSSGKKEKDQAGGVFMQIVKFEGEPILEKEFILPLDVEFFKEGMSERKQAKMDKRAKKGKRVDDFYEQLMINIFNNQDSTFTIVAESFKFYKTEYTDSKGNTIVTYHYEHRDVIFFQISQNGELLRTTRHKRFDHSFTPDIGEVAVYQHDNLIYFLYNDASELTLGVYDPSDYSIKSEVVFERHEHGKYAILMGQFLNLDRNRFQIPLRRGNKNRILEVTFPKGK